MENEQELICGSSNDAIFNDPERS